jgi:hypothetical protein
MDRKVAYYLFHGLTSSTRWTYNTSQKSFVKFVALNGLYCKDGSFLPANQNATLQWICSLAGRVQPRTIKQYIGHIKSLHIDADLPFKVLESPLVQCVIHGIKHVHGKKDRTPKQLITLPVLQKIVASFDLRYNAGIVMAAACCIAYASFLCCGKFTIGSLINTVKFDPTWDLTQGAITFLPDRAHTTSAVLTLMLSKTDPFWKGMSIHLAAAPGASTCLVRALQWLFDMYS